MQYFKSIEGMITHTLANGGEVDDNGNTIVATEQPMSESEYVEYKKNELLPKIKEMLSK